MISVTTVLPWLWTTLYYSYYTHYLPTAHKVRPNRPNHEYTVYPTTRITPTTSKSKRLTL